MDETLSLLIKPVSADCNMRCAYCFYRRAGDPYRSGEPHLMDDRTLRTMIAGYMKSAGACASFGWQGGEPLLAGLEFFRRVVAYQQEYGLSGQLVSNNLQTNGLLIDQAWAEFFRQYRFFVGVSLDGPEELHNRYRRSADGGNGFRQTMQGIGILRKEGVDFSILAVVNEATAKHPRELYDFFRAHGLDRLQFIPCLEFDASDGRVKPFSVTVEDYQHFLCGLFDMWYNDGKPAASIRLFENILAVYLGAEPEICAFKNRCGSYAVVEYNGDVYPCDFFVEETWALGNLLDIPLTELAKKRRRRDFNNRKQQTASACSACEWNFLCHFGCQHYRSLAGANVFCAAYREFFRYTARRFKTLKEGIVQSQWQRTTK